MCSLGSCTRSQKVLVREVAVYLSPRIMSSRPIESPFFSSDALPEGGIDSTEPRVMKYT